LTDPLQDIRPLAVAAPRRTSTGVAFTVLASEVQVRGDARVVESLVGLCDGRRSLREVISLLDHDRHGDVTELAEGLIAQGVLVDCTRAYRVFHWQSSNESPYLRDLDDDQLAALETETFQPRTLAPTEVRLQPRTTALDRLLERRASAWPGTSRPVTFEELSALLAVMYRGPRPPLDRRPVPSGGALYPLAVHVVVREPVGPLGRGLWWYDPGVAAQDAAWRSHDPGPASPDSGPGPRDQGPSSDAVGPGSLRLVRSDRLGLEDVLISDPTTDRLVAAESPALFISADLERGPRKYANRGYRWALVEVGAVMQNAYLFGAELGLPIRAIGGFMDQATRDYLDLAGEVWPMLAVLVGR